MKLTFWGAAETVTGSRILFEHHHYQGLVDCGLFQGPKPLRNLNWTDQTELHSAQCVILTHVHIDHCGFLPRLYKNGFRGRIFCSHPSADLLPIMLLDAAKLQEEDAHYANRSKHSHHDPALPLFDEADANGCLELITGVDWGTYQKLSEHLSFRLLRSSHILGSSYVQIASTDGQTSQILTCSGDIGNPSPLLLREAVGLHESDHLVIESTYGDRKISRENIEDKLADVIQRVTTRGGTLIIPSFAVGRTQDLCYLIAKLKTENKIGDVPLYLDSPMAHRVSEVYLKHIGELRDGLGQNLIETSLAETTAKLILTPEESQKLSLSPEPKIVISASGMLQGGRVMHHLKAKLADKNSGVLFVGYQSEGSKGRLLKDGIKSLRIHHQEIEVLAEIFALDGLSAHADGDELVRWCQALKTPPQSTWINHGETKAIAAFKARLETELKWPHVQAAQMGQLIDLTSTRI